MPSIGTNSKPAYVYDAGTDTWIPIGPGEHTHEYIGKDVITTTGDIIYASAANTPARRGIGSTGQVLTVSGGLPTWATPASSGKVLQVVSQHFTSQQNSSSSTYADTGITASITPSATNSKVLILVTVTGAKSAANAGNRLALKLVRGATDLLAITGGLANVSDNYGLYNNALQSNYGEYSMNYVDSPNTTSSTTYKIQYANGGGNFAQVEVCPGNASSSIVLLEIGA